ncbi:hypothetical protein KsCSTR_15690 [Candidatus Kuenenia stuttgartiensis]|uniref:AsmA-like C-terminal domain-containing protein n=1 Tax=Kuenenia stuttgartiensis TaxID=174633 RepID=Q1Q1N6_KUEST|nr:MULTISPECIES: hypothetical protein [Kuenenia]MBE7548614.1 hypothetical protein [Planctomycetia bacterium]MBZ0190116.1 AsmA-like C-terminal region-containing protein [Candidatus Kuenenia stuttgartiensis]MCF6152226.1 hypothetical protein [Candidatus Kuenenia stuttgartiensis]MCL4727504.1 hypothetical protein [Candidatus Kuenenia stuttgartiensis]MCZ7621526.1 AsmA-like C-terminal region-containing protein [Candidatus Kuenenia sp.]
MKKIVFIIFVCFSLIIAGAGIAGYIFISKLTSDEAIKGRILDAFQNLGDIHIERAHFNFAEGILLEDIFLSGKSGIMQNKFFKCQKVVIEYDLKRLLKKEFNVVKIIAINPELTVEKPAGIWELLDGIKEGFENANLPLFSDVLHNGIEARGLKVHIKENPELRNPEIKLSGINISFMPFAGSFENITARGTIADEHMGNYSFSMKMCPDIPALSITLDAHNMTLNEEFLCLFPFYGKHIWDEYQPEGKVNFSCIASFNNKNNQEKIDYDVTIHLNALNAIYKDLSLPASNVNGVLKMSNNTLYISNITAYIKNGDYTSQVDLKGTVNLSGKEKIIVANVPNLFINKHFLENIPRFGKEVWSKLQPTGFADITFQYSEGEDTNGNIFLVADCKDVAVNSPEMPFPLSYINGPIKFCNNIILLKNTSGFLKYDNQHIFMEINGIYNIETERKMLNVNIPNVVVTENFLNILSEKTAIKQKLWDILNPRGKANLTVVFQGFKEAERNDYTVEVNLKDFEIRNDTYKFALWGIDGRLDINKEQLYSKHINANCWGGNVDGSISIKTNTEPYKYEGELTFSRIVLEEFVKKFNLEGKQLSGILDGRVKYHGYGSDLKDFYAEGQINITNGYLSDIPIILNIFKFFNLRLPQKETFDTAKLNFSVKDNVVNIIEGIISSDTVDLVGKGDIGLNGTLGVTVVTGFEKGFFSQLPLIGNLFDFVVGGVRKQLTVVEIKGTISDPEIHPVPFKPFRKSIKNMFEVMPNTENSANNTTIKNRTSQ